MNEQITTGEISTLRKTGDSQSYTFGATARYVRRGNNVYLWDEKSVGPIDFYDDFPNIYFAIWANVFQMKERNINVFGLHVYQHERGCSKYVFDKDGKWLGSKDQKIFNLNTSNNKIPPDLQEIFDAVLAAKA